MSPTDALVIVLVIVAASLGAVVRYLMALRFDRELPVGTLAVNLAASAALGLAASAPTPAATVLGVGALGALSTWSAVANEAAAMARDGHGGLAIGYLALTATSGVLAAWIGLRLGVALFG
ncbi:MAG: CrcB family protein [Actinomycetota bacterium]